MNIKYINSAFIDKVKSKTDSSIIDTLTDILSLSKEAVYRRLRGDVQFSYTEVSMISQKLQISLDELVFGTNNYFEFRTLVPQHFEVDKTYAGMLKSSVQALNEEAYSADAHLYMASSDIPLLFIGEHEHLSRFYYYKILHNSGGTDAINKKYAEIEVPQHITDELKIFIDSFWSMNTTFVLSDSMFEQYLKTLRYFIAIELIEKTEVEFIKKDLLAMIDQMETITTTGKHQKGSLVTAYLSEINIDSAWGYIKGENNEIAFSRVLLADHVISQNPTVCKIYSDSIDNLKKYAILISQSGSTQRTKYFRKQRLLIEETLS